MSSSPHQERLAHGGVGVSISTDYGTVVDRTSRVARELHYSPALFAIGAHSRRRED